MTKTPARDVMDYYRQIDEKMVALTNAFKNLSNPYFSENVADPKHKVFGVDRFTNGLDET